MSRRMEQAHRHITGTLSLFPASPSLHSHLLFFFFFCMCQYLHRLWKCLRLNTHCRSLIPHTPLPCLQITDCSCTVQPNMLAAILQHCCTISCARSLSVAITDLVLTSTSSTCAPRSVPPFTYPFPFFPSPLLSCP
jgi:hypothetical protein